MIDQEFAESPEGLREEIADLREKLEAARAELQRLQSSPAPVAGGVPDQEWNGPLLWDLLRMDSDEPDWEDAASRVRDWFASRLPAIKTGEVAVSNERLAILEECADTLSDHVRARNMTGWERRARICVNCIDTLRARPTTTEKETP